MRRMIWLAGLVGLASHAHAQEAARPACLAQAGPPQEFAAWNAPRPLSAAASADGVEAAVLPLGAARSIALLPVGQLRYAASPMREDEGAAHGGLIALEVAAGGVYRVALGSGAWIEVIRGARVRQSVGHGHGPECSGIRKIVDFELAPGRYLLQLSDSKERVVTAMIARAARP